MKFIGESEFYKVVGLTKEESDNLGKRLEKMFSHFRDRLVEKGQYDKIEILQYVQDNFTNSAEIGFMLPVLIASYTDSLITQAKEMSKSISSIDDEIISRIKSLFPGAEIDVLKISRPDKSGENDSKSE
jgi:hypothetical protein